MYLARDTHDQGRDHRALDQQRSFSSHDDQ
jgi:hypothetical protein